MLSSGTILISANAGAHEMSGSLCAPNFFSTSWQNDEKSSRRRCLGDGRDRSPGTEVAGFVNDEKVDLLAIGPIKCSQLESMFLGDPVFRLIWAVPCAVHVLR